MAISNPVIPANATPEACIEIVDAYARYLSERTSADFGSDPDRKRKVNGSTDWCESTLAFYLGFLIGPDGSSTGLVSDTLTQIAGLRDAYDGIYTVPDIEGNALKMAKSLAKQKRSSVRASVARQQAQNRASQPVQGHTAVTPTIDPLDAMEAALARGLGLSLDEYRALDLTSEDADA